MFYAYVIRSVDFPSYFYKGHCENLVLRLKQHNSGITKSISYYAPFALAYFEALETRQKAISRKIR